MSRIERNDTKISNSGKKIKSFWQNGKKEPFFWLTLYKSIISGSNEDMQKLGASHISMFPLILAFNFI